MTYIHDACALIAYLRQELGAQQVANLLLEQDSEHVVHAVNLCEVYYDTIRASGAADADIAMTEIASAGVVTRSDLDESLWKAAAQLKADGGLSIADCFAVALAQRLDGTLVTADHREFDPIAAQGRCKVTFIR